MVAAPAIENGSSVGSRFEVVCVVVPAPLGSRLDAQSNPEPALECVEIAIADTKSARDGEILAGDAAQLMPELGGLRA